MYQDNITYKKDLVKYFNDLHKWQINDKNQISFDLTIFSFPISLISIQESFNLFNSAEYLNSNENELSDDIILFKVEELQRKVEKNEILLNFNKIFNKKTPDLKLKMSTTYDSDSLFYFKEYNGEWFSIVNNNNNYNLQYVSSNHRKINYETLKTINDFIESFNILYD